VGRDGLRTCRSRFGRLENIIHHVAKETASEELVGQRDDYEKRYGLRTCRPRIKEWCSAWIMGYILDHVSSPKLDTVSLVFFFFFSTLHPLLLYARFLQLKDNVYQIHFPSSDQLHPLHLRKTLLSKAPFPFLHRLRNRCCYFQQLCRPRPHRLRSPISPKPHLLRRRRQRHIPPNIRRSLLRHHRSLSLVPLPPPGSLTPQLQTPY
jgi:hypothetical protein